MNPAYMNYTLNILKRLLFAHGLFLLLMSAFRFVFFLYYSPLQEYGRWYSDLLEAFFLGFRIDLTVVGYIQILPTLLLIGVYYVKSTRVLSILNRFFIYYLFVMYTVAMLLLCADFGFYSYFKDHINVLFFGLIDDDTKALMVTMWQNYNVLAIFGAFALYLAAQMFILQKIFALRSKEYRFFSKLRFSGVVFLLVFVLNFLAVRGSFGMYPLGKMIPNVSKSEFINRLSQNGVRAFVDAYKQRREYLNSEYDLIEKTGFKDNIEQAFKIHTGKETINTDDLRKNITYQSKKIADKEYNVVILMVESFGMPILQYQSKEFDILGRLKKHFDEDVLFTNFISTGNGTTSTLQPFLLGLPHRPDSFAYSQSHYSQTSFDFAPAFTFANNGYETSFVYGGDLTWRSLDKFVKHQGFKNVEGKINVHDWLENKEDKEYFHPWGIYDEYLYDYLFAKLQKTEQKQMIVALSTNNHPPYNIPAHFDPKPMRYSQEIKDHITGDMELAKKRFASYKYAVDSAGAFVDKIKNSPLKDNTIVVITADNNTIDGIMRYDDRKLCRSKNIPLYFYLPKELKDKLAIDTKVAGSHKDIFPTLYNLVLDTKYTALGSDLFDPGAKHIGFNGDMVVFEGGNARRLDKLKKQISEPALLHYIATLAVTDWIVKNQ